MKESCHLRKWEHITTPQMFSQSLFSPQCWAHLPKLNLFKDSSLSQVFKVSSIVQVPNIPRDQRGSHVEDQRLARPHQVCAQHQGQVCMINFEAFQNQQHFMIQRFRSASRWIQRAFTPPPSRRGSENQDSGHSDVQLQIQESQKHVIQNVSATSRWWALIALIMSIMHFMVKGYQLSVAMFKKVKQITVMLMNVNQVSVTIIMIINQRRRQVQRRNQTRQSGQTRQSRSQYLCTFILFSALFATCILIVFRFMSFNQSLSQSSCLTAVSNSVESHHSQVLHLLPASVVTFAFRMSAAAAPQPVTEAAQLVAQSLQSMSIAHAKNEELNNLQVPMVRHALSQVESTQKDQELQRVMEMVKVNKEPSRDEHLLKCLIKSQMADHPQQWDDHCSHIRYFLSSFKYYQGDFETLHKVSQGHDRYYLVLSESEYQSWQTYGWIRPPRVSNELVGPQDQIHHAIHMLNRLGDAVNHLYYLRVAHSFMFNCHSESGHGRYYIFSGTLRSKVDDIPEITEESRARILRIVIDQDSMSYTDEVKYRKVKLRQFFKFHQIWSAETEMFNLSQTASSFMTQYVLYHESVAISNSYMSETILEIMQHPQVRLTERVIKIIRNSHPHMEALLISDGEFRQSVRELEIDRSFTVIDMRANPWEIKGSASSSMEVEGSSFKRGKRTSSSSAGSAVLTINSGRLTFG